jgi:hypothetical protein
MSPSRTAQRKVCNAVSGVSKPALFQGTVHWAKPAGSRSQRYPEGFTNYSVVSGSRYLRPASSTIPVLPLTEMDLAFIGGNLSQPLTNRIALVARNKISNLGPGELRMSFSLSSGLFSGKVVDPSTGTWMPFKGALLQDRNSAAGFILGADKSGLVGFGP